MGNNVFKNKYFVRGSHSLWVAFFMCKCAITPRLMSITPKMISD